jgi:4-hydroxybenzoate polyprenyltransferase
MRHNIQINVFVQLLRGAGCTINDMWDKELDKQVERTRYRPLAAGALGLPAATVFLGLQLSVGLIILLQLNDFTKLLGVASLPLVAAYPLMKRVTNLVRRFHYADVHFVEGRVCNDKNRVLSSFELAVVTDIAE